MRKKHLSLLLRIVIGIILLQTLYFKWGGHAEAVHIFSTLGVEPWGRLVLGGLELITAVLLLTPKTQLRGTVMTIGIMAGALCSHLFTPLGIEIEWDGNNDNGLLFGMALLCFVFAIINLLMHRNEHSFSFKKILRM